jgi:glycosyltransferase involved in cell wall biosynthesis
MNIHGSQSVQVSASTNTPDRVVLINDFSKVRGGAAALVALLAKELSEMNIDVTLITGDDGQDLKGQLNNVEVVPLDEPPLLDRPAKDAALKGLYNPAARRMLSDWILQNDTPRTVYHVHNWAHILSASIFRSLRVVSRRTVMHAHDYFLACPNGAYADYRTGKECTLSPLSFACLSTNCDRRSYSHKLWRAGRHMIRQALWDFDKHRTDILMIHEGMREPFERAGFAPSQLLTVRNPSVPYADIRIRAEENKEYVFIGRVEEEKGVSDFLAAARRANVPARVIGDGSKLRELAEQFPEAVFNGWQSRNGIAELLGSARMLVVPSRYPEPFGLVIVESLGTGVPVILPHNASLQAEVTHQGIGIACDTRSIDELTKVIEATRIDDEKISSMSRQAFDRRNSFTVDPGKWSAQIFSYYQALLTRAGRGHTRSH